MSKTMTPQHRDDSHTDRSDQNRRSISGTNQPVSDILHAIPSTPTAPSFEWSDEQFVKACLQGDERG